MLICFTSSHRTAGFDLLERLERRAAAITDALVDTTFVDGAVVLATCNRFEAYLDVRTSGGTAASTAVDACSQALLETISGVAGLDSSDLHESSAVIHDHAVAEHLFAVSSGLESVVVGEGEIAGQVRRALHSARAAGTVTRDLERLFQGASRISRGVKNNTGLARAGRSIVRLALELAASRITDWADARVLLVGTGSYAGASLAALRERGASDVRVFSRTGRAAGFAASHAIEAVPTGGLVDAIAAADLIVTCSVAPSVIIDRAILQRAAALPGALPRRLVIDLGLPRNVDPDAGAIDGVELLDLETISLHAPLEELNSQADARTIVGDAAATFAAAGAEQAVEPALVALRTHVLGVLDAELERVRKRGGDDTGRVEAALRHLAGVLLHTPSVRARELARDGDADAFVAGAHALFGVQADEPALLQPALLQPADEQATG